MNLEQKNRKKRRDNFKGVVVGCASILMGIFFTIIGVYDCMGLNGELINLNEASASDLQDGDFVELDVNYAYYSFCENVETTNYIFKRTTHQYYLIDSLQDDYYFIGLKISDSKTDDLEALSDYTFYVTDTNPGTLHYVGKIKSANNELYGYMQDYVYDLYSIVYGYTLTDDDKEILDSYMLPCYVEVMTPSSYIKFIVIGLLFFIGGIIVIIISVMNKKNTVVIPDTPVAPYSDDNSENSVSSAPDSIPFSTTYSDGATNMIPENGDGTDYSGLNKDTFK